MHKGAIISFIAGYTDIFLHEFSKPSWSENLSF